MTGQAGPGGSTTARSWPPPLALLPDGELVAGWWAERKVRRRGVGCLNVQLRHHLSPAGEQGVLDLDFDVRHRHVVTGTTLNCGNLPHGPRLLRATPGTGPEAELATGRTPAASSPVAVRELLLARSA